jgi:hypothetical protein
LTDGQTFADSEEFRFLVNANKVNSSESQQGLFALEEESPNKPD